MLPHIDRTPNNRRDGTTEHDQKTDSQIWNQTGAGLNFVLNPLSLIGMTHSNHLAFDEGGRKNIYIKTLAFVLS